MMVPPRQRPPPPCPVFQAHKFEGLKDAMHTILDGVLQGNGGVIETQDREWFKLGNQWVWSFTAARHRFPVDSIVTHIFIAKPMDAVIHITQGEWVLESMNNTSTNSITYKSPLIPSIPELMIVCNTNSGLPPPTINLQYQMCKEFIQELTRIPTSVAFQSPSGSVVYHGEQLYILSK